MSIQPPHSSGSAYSRGHGEATDASPVETPIADTTGVDGADRALRRLREVSSAPLDEHVDLYDEVQRELHDALTQLDDG